jgi:hypothetical protein
MKPPSTAWKEVILPDEAERHAGYVTTIAAIGKAKSEKYGAGRVLHRKQRAGARATFEVLPGLPEHAAHGLFATPTTFEARVRLSNGNYNKQSDRTGDIRGFAISVRGVNGPSTFGVPAQFQDFGLINREAFTSRNSDEFVSVMVGAQSGLLSLTWHLVRTYGLFHGLGSMMVLARQLSRPFTGFATETFWSAAPLRCGPYACRVRVLPASSEVNPGAAEDWHADIRDRLRKAPLVQDFQLQFFVDEQTTPIEDASVDWPESEAPYLTVARLTLLQQDLDSEDGEKTSAEAEAGIFDPWQALEDHRPLGEVMRARKAVYFTSQQARQAGWK